MEKISNWSELLKKEVHKPYYSSLICFLNEEYGLHDNDYNPNPICPPRDKIWEAFKQTPYEEVKVVILGQDPYYTPGIANGLAFSCSSGISPSLNNIYKEIENDLKLKMSNENGDLTDWANQGVFLLNTVLTVRAGKSGGHRKKGWEEFTDNVISTLSKKGGIVFMLWGNDAKSKLKLIDRKHNFTLTAAHPSPLSAHRGFFGCKHFSKANKWLKSKGQEPIDWQIV